jgi:hypothetical protein
MAAVTTPPRGLLCLPRGLLCDLTVKMAANIAAFSNIRDLRGKNGNQSSTLEKET